MQGKVKAVADAVWARLSGSFSKDVLHAQHTYVFVQILRAGKASKGVRKCTRCFYVYYALDLYYALVYVKECSARHAARTLQLVHGCATPCHADQLAVPGLLLCMLCK